MTHRSDRIPLDASEVRCNATKPCTMKSSCARWQAALPVHYARVMDYTLEDDGGTAKCSGYLSIAAVYAQAKAAKPGPKVHPSL